MAKYGITEDGFVRKTRQEIEEDLILKTKNKMGEGFNTSDKNPWVKFLKIISYPISLYWMALESLYNNRWIGTATGQTLDEVVQYLGLNRREGTKAVVDLDFTGDNLTFIPEGFLVETDEKVPIQFGTVESGYIESGSLTLQARAVEKGTDGNVNVGTLTEIVNPISGLDSVTNPTIAEGGSDREEDWELRERYYDSYDKAGGSTITSIRANILQETDVTDCIVLENYTETTDGNGLPMKSIEAIVYGGTDEDIADAIFQKKAGGIRPHGDTTIQVTDELGTNHPISFTRAVGVEIHIDMDLNTNEDYPIDGDGKVKEELTRYIEKLPIQEDVIYKKLYDVIFNVEGVYDVNSLYLGTSASPTGETNIDIGEKEVSIASEDWIVIA